MDNKLASVRKQKNLSKTQLSKISGVSRPIIIKIERGGDIEVKTSTLVKLADALGTSVSEIFF